VVAIDLAFGPGRLSELEGVEAILVVAAGDRHDHVGSRYTVVAIGVGAVDTMRGLVKSKPQSHRGTAGVLEHRDGCSRSPPKRSTMVLSGSWPVFDSPTRLQRGTR